MYMKEVYFVHKQAEALESLENTEEDMEVESMNHQALSWKVLLKEMARDEPNGSPYKNKREKKEPNRSI